MSPRKLIAALAIAATSFTTAAYADDAQKGVNVDAQFAGSIIATVIGDSPVAKGEQAGPGYVMTGNCTFAGVLTPNNRLQVAFGGHAEATGPQLTQLTYVKCSVSNQDAQSDSSEFANGGAVSQTAKTTSPWKVSPILVCVEGFAVYGPTPVTIVTMVKQCNTIIG
jgi:hypothetical protein